jgi:Sec-independent protein translocase protein TatA
MADQRTRCEAMYLAKADKASFQRIAQVAASRTHSRHFQSQREGHTCHMASSATLWGIRPAGTASRPHGPTPHKHAAQLCTPSSLSPAATRRGLGSYSGKERGAFPRSPQWLKRRENKDRSSVVVGAIFGVGAPEAILVGVVALVLFGPKGLAQAAKSFGQVVKSVAPTLKELTDISTDLKSTIEDEIGLSEIRDELQSTLSPLSAATTSKPRPMAPLETAVTEDPDIEKKREAAMKAAWGGAEDQALAPRQVPVAEQGSAVDALSTEELEKIIAQRKAQVLEDGKTNE